MGRDIHAFIELASRSAPGHFCAASRGEINFARDDDLFQALAGDPQSENPPLYPPRGLPEQGSSELKERYFTPIVEDEEAPPDRSGFYMLRSEVERMMKDKFHVAHLRCHYWGGPDGPRKLISDPDSHTPSWLTHRELLAALEHHDLSVAEQHVWFRAAVAAMAELAREYGPDRVRMVFWFDN
jgi:hypothetical protein